MGSNSLCTDAVKIILCICLDKRRESKTFCMLHESIISSFRYEYISLDSDAMCRLIRPLFPFVYSAVVFYSLFRGTSLFFGSYFDCDVTVCSVRYDVLLGMELLLFFFFFRLNYLKQDFQVTQKYPSFYYSSIMFKNRICTALF